MGENAQRLLNDVQTQLTEYQTANAKKFEANVTAFLNQCPNDAFLKDAKVEWDGKGEFDFLWDTDLLDCRFSVGLMETSWHYWSGVNTHQKDDECYQHGIGGMDIKGNEDDFAYYFFDAMTWDLRDTISKGKNSQAL